MGKEIKSIRTLLLYQVFNERAERFYKNLISRLQEHGFNVQGFCVTLDPPNSRLSFDKLDAMWKSDNVKLRNLYTSLKYEAANKDVLVLFNGANLHPEFLQELKTFNAFMCFDDPESSDNLSKPVAKFFDACFVGNIASINQYLSWGCKNVYFRPLGFSSIDVIDLPICKEYILNKKEDIDVFFFGERTSPWRNERFAYIEQHIPNFYGAGHGWEKGFVAQAELLNIYKRAKIGLNIHNSTGPINLRTYTLPANGLMQICDNKYFLGHIFELNKEVVGFCDIEEVPELLAFYLKNDELRKQIAYQGWLRAIKEYDEVKVWEKQMVQISKLM